MEPDPNGKSELVAQYWKTLREQMHVIGQFESRGDHDQLEFVRIHAQAIIQLCDQIRYLTDGYTSVQRSELL